MMTGQTHIDVYGVLCSGQRISQEADFGCPSIINSSTSLTVLIYLHFIYNYILIGPLQQSNTSSPIKKDTVVPTHVVIPYGSSYPLPYLIITYILFLLLLLNNLISTSLTLPLFLFNYVSLFLGVLSILSLHSIFNVPGVLLLLTLFNVAVLLSFNSILTLSLTTCFIYRS